MIYFRYTYINPRLKLLDFGVQQYYSNSKQFFSRFSLVLGIKNDSYDKYASLSLIQNINFPF